MANQENKAKRSIPGWLLAAAVLVMSAAAGVVLIEKGLLWFNMPSKNLYPVRGVDVSHYQGEIDWETIRGQEIDFAFLKATEGSGTVDETFADNWKNARAAGLAVGAYHFFSFDSSGETQTANFLKTVPAAANAMPPVIDLEYYDSEGSQAAETVRRELRVMLDALKTRYGKTPIIYTTQNFWEKYLRDTDFEYTLWIRSVYSSPSSKLSPQWSFWQYNSRGVLEGYHGVETKIDLNAYRGTREEFEKQFAVKLPPQITAQSGTAKS